MVKSPWSSRRLLEATVLLLCVLVPLAVYPPASDPLSVKRLVLELVGAVVFLTWLGHALLQRQVALPGSALVPPVLVWLAVMLAGAAGARYRYASFSQLGLLGSYVVCFFAVLSYLERPEQVRRLTAALGLGAGLAAAYALLQAAGAGWQAPAVTGGVISSTLGGPSDLAGFLVLFLPLLLVEVWRAAGWRRLIPGLGAALLAACLLVAGYSPALLGLLVGLPITAWLAAGPRWRRLLGILAVGAAVLAVLLGAMQFRYLQQRQAGQVRLGQTPPAGDPWARWRGALLVWRDHPVAGVGLAGYRFYLPAYQPLLYPGEGWPAPVNHARSQGLEMLAETGVVGLAAFLWVLGSFLFLLARASRRELLPAWRAGICGLGGGALAFLVYSIASGTTDQVAAWLALWIALAVVAAGYRQSTGDTAKIGAAWRPWPRLVPAMALGAVALGLTAALWAGGRFSSSEEHLAAAQSALHRGEWHEAEKECRQAIAANPYSLPAYDRLAYSLTMMGRHAEAIACFQRLATLHPHYPHVHYHLGALYRSLGQHQLAAGQFQQAVLEAGSALDHAALAQAYRELGRTRWALWHAQQACRLAPANADLQALRAGLAAAAHPGELSAAYARLLRMDPDSKEGHFQLGEACRRRADWAGAIRHYRKVAAIDPCDPVPWNNIGAAYLELERYAPARQCLKRALSLPGPPPEAHYNQALALLQLGRTAEAKKSFLAAARYSAKGELGLQARVMAERLGGYDGSR